MHKIIKESINSMDAALELCRLKKNVVDVVDGVTELDIKDACKLGMNFKKFPLGCDLTEIIVGPCASDLTRQDILGNCILSNMIGAPLHICAYAIADIAEANGMKPVELFREINAVIEVPLDLDHFGKYGPMRFPIEITQCIGDCYYTGAHYKGCPHKRILYRLIEKEKEGGIDKEEWIRLSSSVAVNLIGEQGGRYHAAPLEEAKEIANLAKRHGKGVDAIMCIGDGYDDLITGFETGIKIGADVFILEGGPFNNSRDRLDSFAKAVAMARILVPGKVVATNGAYEDECRVGLRAGLNAIITGFPNNHHGYMCGYSAGTAKRGNFGLPRVIKIIKDEIPRQSTGIPIQRGELEALAKAVRIVGRNNIYPKKIGSLSVGDAHWVTIANSNLYKDIIVKKAVKDIPGVIKGKTVALLGGRFVSWVIAKELDGIVDEIIISDADPWVERVTVQNLSEELGSNVTGAGSDDEKAVKESKNCIITTTIPQIVNKIFNKISRKIEGVIVLV